jgi:hypothetical protein
LKRLAILLVLSLLGFAASAQAQKKPSYADARKLYEEIDKSLSATGLWYKKPLQERIRGRQSASALIERAEKLMGPSSRCREAAIFMHDYLGSLNDFALVVEGRRQISNPHELFAPMFNAVVFGEKKVACYEEVEALDTPAKRS